MKMKSKTTEGAFPGLCKGSTWLERRADSTSSRNASPAKYSRSFHRYRPGQVHQSNPMPLAPHPAQLCAKAHTSLLQLTFWCLLDDDHTFAPLVVGRRVSFDCRTRVKFVFCLQSCHSHLTALPTQLRWLKHLRAAKKVHVIHVWFNMAAEQPLDAVAGVIWRRSEKERRCDNEDGYAAWETLRGYCEAGQMLVE